MPKESPLITLVSKDKNKQLWVYARTLAEIISQLPAAFKMSKGLPSEGDDETYMEKEVMTYTNKKIVVIVKRFSNRVTVRAQMMFDRENKGKI